MTCEHPTRQVVCGVVRCGQCYERWLLTAPDRNRERKPFEAIEGYASKFRGYGQKVAPVR